jgi:hypothetical protein
MGARVIRRALSVIIVLICDGGSVTSAGFIVWTTSVYRAWLTGFTSWIALGGGFIARPGTPEQT